MALGLDVGKGLREGLDAEVGVRALDKGIRVGPDKEVGVGPDKERRGVRQGEGWGGGRSGVGWSESRSYLRNCLTK